jgi:uncharacterized protein (TIGR02145 family)
MKKTFTLTSIIFILLSYSYAQSPESFKYQAVVRDVSGNIVADQAVGLFIEILQTSIDGTVIYSESHTSTTNNFGLVNIYIGDGTVESGTFADIEWGIDSYFVRVSIDLTGGTSYNEIGTGQLLSVPYALHSKTAGSLTDPVWNQNGDDIYYNSGNIGIGTDAPNARVEIKTIGFTGDTLFCVKDSEGNPVFTVFSDAVEITVPENGKNKINPGAFLVSGRSETKETNSFFMVTPDSTRVFVKDPTTKGVSGGFAVGKYGAAKNVNTIFSTNEDSTRIFTNSETGKAFSGGFAVGKYGAAKNGFNYIDITPENTFIGQEAGVNTTGTRNAFVGYQAGFMNTTGYDNVFMGDSAGRNSTTGRRNIFIGSSSGKDNTDGWQNIAIGLESGLNLEAGVKNVLIGTHAGAFSNGDNNVMIGNFAGEQNTGSNNVYIGRTAGLYNEEGNDNVYLGEGSGLFNETGSNNVFVGKYSGYYSGESSGSVFLGNYAGLFEINSNRLYIANSETYDPLIYGEFDNAVVKLNSSLNIRDVLHMEPRYTYPGDPEEGDIFYHSNSNSIKFYNGSQWMELSATPVSGLAEVRINDIPEITVLGTSAMIDCEVTSDGGSAIIECGIYYSTQPFFDGNVNIISYATPGVGTYSIDMADLFDQTIYYVRAYAINLNGVVLGDMQSFTTTDLSTMPTIETKDIVGVGVTEATGSGDLQSPGGTEVTAMGLCWSIDPEPTLDDDFTSESVNISYYESIMTGLTPGTTYYFRAYATNSNGTAYGEDIEFTTFAEEPTISTNPVVNIDQTSATGGGTIIFEGASGITASGVCWSLNPNPTTSDNSTNEGAASGSYDSNITGLSSETTYYVRAYATNSFGTSYGEEVIFITASDVTTVSDVDGNTYNTVQIGTQTWMQENLKTTKFNTGEDIPNVSDSATWEGLSTPAYCWYQNDEASHKDAYGALYNYFTIEYTANICPDGWHVPSFSEYDELINYLGGYLEAAYRMKETGTTHWILEDADNSSGFTARGAGEFWPGQGFIGLTEYTEYWTTDSNESDGIFLYLTYHNQLALYPGGKTAGVSVRCIKD